MAKYFVRGRIANAAKKVLSIVNHPFESINKKLNPTRVLQVEPDYLKGKTPIVGPLPSEQQRLPQVKRYEREPQKTASQVPAVEHPEVIDNEHRLRTAYPFVQSQPGDRITPAKKAPFKQVKLARTDPSEVIGLTEEQMKAVLKQDPGIKPLSASQPAPNPKAAPSIEKATPADTAPKASVSARSARTPKAINPTKDDDLPGSLITLPDGRRMVIIDTNEFREMGQRRVVSTSHPIVVSAYYLPDDVQTEEEIREYRLKMAIRDFNKAVDQAAQNPNLTLDDIIGTQIHRIHAALGRKVASEDIYKEGTDADKPEYMDIEWGTVLEKKPHLPENILNEVNEDKRNFFVATLYQNMLQYPGTNPELDREYRQWIGEKSSSAYLKSRGLSEDNMAQLFEIFNKYDWWKRLAKWEYLNSEARDVYTEGWVERVERSTKKGIELDWDGLKKKLDAGMKPTELEDWFFNELHLLEEEEQED